MDITIIAAVIAIGLMSFVAGAVVLYLIDDYLKWRLWE